MNHPMFSMGAGISIAACAWLGIFFEPPVLAQDPPSFTPRISLTASQINALRKSIQTDATAALAFDPVKKVAERALGEKAHPVRKIVSEGRLHSDPEKKATLLARHDLFKIEALGYAYAISGRTAFAEKAREFIVAWAEIYEPDGNPINETEFVRMMKGYDLSRGLFTAQNRSEADRWLLRMAEQEKAAIRPASATSKNNHHSHRLKIVGHAVLLLNRPDLLSWTTAEYKRHLDVNLYPDGTTYDFRQRDALHYHVYDLLPLVELALAFEKNGENLFGYTTPQGANLDKAIAFLIPYITGEKTHREFVRSTAKFDLERGEEGDPSIRVGANWNPVKAKALFDRAGHFNPRFHEVRFPGDDGKVSFDRLLATYR